jgi:hypothetical protein
LDRSGKIFASGGMKFDNLPITSKLQYWQILTDSSGARYREITLPLYTQKQVSGYLQLARNLTDLDQHLTYLRLTLTLVLGLPISMIFVGLSSWWWQEGQCNLYIFPTNKCNNLLLMLLMSFTHL